MTDYTTLIKQADALIRDVPHLISNIVNLSALLNESLPDINWVGFYLLEGDTLILGPFQGKVACTVIPVGKGVCGTAVKEKRTIRVEDVHTFPGHIACDSASRSEIVIPIRHNGTVIGVLDIDSPVADRLSAEDQDGLETLVSLLESTLHICTKPLR